MSTGHGRATGYQQADVEVTVDVPDHIVVTGLNDVTAGGGEPVKADVRSPDKSTLKEDDASVGFKFIGNYSGDWLVVKSRFHRLSDSTTSLLHRSCFDECIGMRRDSKEFALLIFDSLARRHSILSDSVTLSELKVFWEEISSEDFNVRFQIFFDMMDKDGDGRITQEEIREMISICASCNRLPGVHKRANEYATVIMEQLDPDNHGYTTIEKLIVLFARPSRGSPGRKISPELSRLLGQKLKWYLQIKNLVLDNWQRVWLMTVWIGLMLGLFSWKFVQYQDSAAYDVMGSCICIEKGVAEILKLNMALILLPVCRNTITWLRNKTELGVAVPFDDNINFHEVIAVAVAVGVGIHAVLQFACNFPRLLHASPTKLELVVPYYGEQLTSYWQILTSFQVVSGVIMAVLMAIAFTLAWKRFRHAYHLPRVLQRFSGFDAFWYSHHLFIIVYSLLIAHGSMLFLTHKWYKKTTWMYLIVPVIVYALERLIRILRPRNKLVTVLKASFHAENVMTLYMTKPQGFEYKSGQYIYMNCPTVSSFEWHPFHVTSAPADDYLSVHIRTLGDWTSKLNTVFSEASNLPPTGKYGLLRASCLQGERNVLLPRVLIDGPYGHSSQDYLKYDLILLVGLGIGAAPMFSIAKDILNNVKASEGNNGDSGMKMKLKKAYLYLISRDESSLDCFNEQGAEEFSGAMNEMAGLHQKGILEMHNYCTSVYDEGDARAVVIAMLQSLIHEKSGVDIISGTPVMSHFYRPNWRKVYEHISLNHPRCRVGVFYNGSPVLATQLRQLALDFSHKTSTKFEFHE